ncbi:hypothetical protein BGZ68_003464 [Mortierella alpina]|nr:hypothetical protein BGZ68_003464 [Mortierella alpina]
MMGARLRRTKLQPIGLFVPDETLYAMMLSTELLLPSILVYHLSHQGKVRSSESPQFPGVYSDEIKYYRIRVCQRVLSSTIFCTNKTSPPTVIISFDVP